MLKVKNLIKVSYWVVLTALVAIAAGVALSVFNTPLGIRLFSVQSGSMVPAIPLGSLVVVEPADTYQKGDVITIKAERDPKETVTHRIVDIVEDEDLERVSYQTKGDANEDPDRELIADRRVVGKVVFNIPYLGYPIAFAQTQVGFAVLIIIPATIIIYSELMNIKKEIAKSIKGRKKKEKKEE